VATFVPVLRLRLVYRAAQEERRLVGGHGLGLAIHGAMVQLLILTGQRRGEAAGLEQAELD